MKEGVLCCVEFGKYFHPLAVNLREGVGELLYAGQVSLLTVPSTVELKIKPTAAHPDMKFLP